MVLTLDAGILQFDIAPLRRVALLKGLGRCRAQSPTTEFYTRLAGS